MKHTYIESLLTEIQLLATKVENLKENNRVPFSFFKESFKRTQEITRLLHELEFVQIEEMKGQMEKLMQFLSDAENSKKEAIVETIVAVAEVDKTEVSSNNKEQKLYNAEEVVEEAVSEKDDKVLLTEEKQQDLPVAEHIVDEEELEDDVEEDDVEEVEDEEEKSPSSHSATVEAPTKTPQHISSVLSNKGETILANIAPKNKSLNDVQPVNQTIQDVQRSISLNDRFLFQRELFSNNRDAMNTMLTKLQSFSSFALAESYLKRNTTWDFRDETVDKFLQMLKDSFR